MQPQSLSLLAQPSLDSRMKAIALLAASVFAVGSRADDAAAETDQSLPSYTPPRHRSPPLPLEHHRRRHHSRHCADLRDSCGDRVHECDTHRRWMHPHCPVTCQVCHTRVQSVPRRSAFGPATLTLSDNDDDDSDDGGNNGRIYDAVGASIGVPQIVAGTEEQRAAIARVVTESTAYYQTIVMKQERYVTVREACKNTNSMCAIYEAMEERCHDDDDGGNDDEGNGSNVVMARDCAVTCRRCEALSPAAQCPYDPNTMRNAWYPGDVDAMFERIVRDSKDRTTPYDIQILSRPQSSSADSNAVDGPWVVTLDHFLSDEECDRLIVLGDSANDGAGYERSVGMRLDRAGVLEEVVSDQRTSQTAWCNAVDCRSDPVAKAVRHRMANLTRIPTTHFEPLQLLRYEPGEFYKVKTNTDALIPRHRRKTITALRVCPLSCVPSARPSPTIAFSRILLLVAFSRAPVCARDFRNRTDAPRLRADGKERIPGTAHTHHLFVPVRRGRGGRDEFPRPRADGAAAKGPGAAVAVRLGRETQRPGSARPAPGPAGHARRQVRGQRLAAPARHGTSGVSGRAGFGQNQRRVDVDDDDTGNDTLTCLGGEKQ